MKIRAEAQGPLKIDVPLLLAYNADWFSFLLAFFLKKIAAYLTFETGFYKNILFCHYILRRPACIGQALKSFCITQHFSSPFLQGEA